MYICVSKVKEIAKSNDKQLSKEYLTSLDMLVERIVRASCQQDNKTRVMPLHIPGKVEVI